MRYFPAFLDLDGRPCLVVGGGAAATRKTELLMSAGARVGVIAPRPEPALEALASAGRIALHRRTFVARDVLGQSVVIGAVGTEAEDEAVAAAAVAHGVPVNIVDRPSASSFIAPAIVDRGALVVGITTGGAAPVLARRVRAAIEALLPARIDDLVRFAARFRGAVKAAIPTFAARRRFWEGFFDGPLADAVLRGEGRAAQARMLAAINVPAAAAEPRGRVAIVGAGPGAADLLTLRAVHFLQDADVIVHDRLVGADVLSYARRDAERIEVGKGKGRPSWSQADINDLLVAEAGAGKRVVRLKGGDPYIFGRGGEERAHLLRHGIAVEVVPGITAATAAGAAAGIPLTHRGSAQAVTLVTGHAADGGLPDLDWRALARLGQTLAIYMGLTSAAALARTLIEYGLVGATPVAVIENATLPQERVLVGRLDGLDGLIRTHGLEGPGLIVVGDVVREADAAALAVLAEAV